VETKLGCPALDAALAAVSGEAIKKYLPTATVLQAKAERDALIKEVLELRHRVAAAEPSHLWPDKPEFDGTDGAHPAWWRGNRAGAVEVAAALERLAREGQVLGSRFAQERVQRAANEITKLRQQNAELETQLDFLGPNPNDTGLPGFGLDPRDSAALLELREAVDQYLGWENLQQEEAANYPARVIQVGERIRELKNQLRGMGR
jgi:hypothetical protein